MFRLLARDFPGTAFLIPNQVEDGAARRIGDSRERIAQRLIFSGTPKRNHVVTLNPVLDGRKRLAEIFRR